MATSLGTLLLTFMGSFALLKTFSTEVQCNVALFHKDTHTPTALEPSPHICLLTYHAHQKRSEGKV